MNIDSYYNQSVQNFQKACEQQNISVTVIDKNNDGILDMNDEVKYNVQKGDSLYAIGKLFDGYSLDVLREHNEFIKNSDLIRPGDVINIPLNLNNTNQPKQATQPQIQQQPQVQCNNNLFGNIKTKKISDDKTIQSLIGKDAETLKKAGYYFVDKDNDNTFDEGEELHKQVTIMLDAGHGCGGYFVANQSVTIPGKAEKYITKKDDTYASIAKKHKVDLKALVESNRHLKINSDPGALGIGEHNEAYFNGIARDELAEMLEAQGFKVIKNRRVDSANLQKRQQEKLAAMPDMFISLHCDSAGPTANGETVLYQEKASTEDIKFAQAVNEELKKDQTFTNRYMQKRDLSVLRGDTRGKIAEILVELGFVSNQSDYNKLNDSTTRKKQLNAIAKGVLNYYNSEIAG